MASLATASTASSRLCWYLYVPLSPTQNSPETKYKIPPRAGHHASGYVFFTVLHVEHVDPAPRKAVLRVDFDVGSLGIETYNVGIMTMYSVFVLAAVSLQAPYTDAKQAYS